MHFAFDYARQHNHRLVTNVTKSSSTQHNMVFGDDTFQEVAASYPAVATDQQLVDSVTAPMVSHPETVDVISLQPVRRHPHLPGGSVHGQRGPSPQCQPQPRAALPQPVSGHPRLGL